VKCLIIVNESPWQTGLATCALRFAEAAGSVGLQISAVFFREDGVYHALGGTLTDAGTPELTSGWLAIAARTGTRLLLCSASCQRRLPAAASAPEFSQTGLADMLELMQEADQLVTF
jgi:sulfur relay (sulfurtransferase) complex TusBCD TusD component (DsrE family)